MNRGIYGLTSTYALMPQGLLGSPNPVTMPDPRKNVDPFYGQVSLLLHGNGINGSTRITDNSPTPKTVTAVGNAQISTAQSKFGGASIAFDGTGDSLTIPANSDFAFGTENFTVECWLYLTSSTASYAILHGTTNVTNTFGFQLNGSFNTSFVYTVGGSSVTYSSLPLLSKTWQHHALVRRSGTLQWFINGVAQGTRTFSNNVTAIGNLKIGAVSNDSGAFNGYMQDLRLTKGVARYTSNFIPPSATFPDI